jgi:PmbA protein
MTMNEDYAAIAEHVLDLARRAAADDAEVAIVSGRTFSATVRLGETERVTEAATRTLGLRVIKDGRSANRYTADLTPRGLATFVERTLDLAAIADPDPAAGLPDWEERPAPPDLDLSDPALAGFRAEEQIERALAAERAALDFDPRITNSGGGHVRVTLHDTLLLNSRGFSGRYGGTVGALSVEAIADDADGKKRNAGWSTVARHAADLLDPTEVGRIAADRAVRQLGARKVETRAVPVVLDPWNTMGLMGIVARAANGELLHRRASFLIDLEGKPAASELVTLSDEPLVPRRTGSRPFDDEGVASRRNELVTSGVFDGFLFDTYTARRTGRRSTGSSERAIGGGPSIGTSNLVLAPGPHDPAAIIASVEDGLYLTGMIGFGINLTTGTFSRGASGFWIEHGRITYPVSEINISGSLPEMLAGISMVGSDLTWLGSSAAPTIKIDRMMVSGL